MKPTPLQLESLFAHCSAIAFQASTDGMPSIIFVFDNQVTPNIAFRSLLEWASNDEIVAALCRKETSSGQYIEAILIHSQLNEVVKLSGLSFVENEFQLFINSISQSTNVNLVMGVSAADKKIISGEHLSLTLIRYIILQSAN
jgi:hypothetical protein